jgi:hypothetical protein
MLLKRDVDRALVQATYMSGDRNTIATALKLNRKLGVVILTAQGKAASANEFKNFYVSVAGPNRIEVLETRAGNEDPDEVLKDCYRMVNDYCYQKGNYPAFLSRGVERSISIETATYGTKQVEWSFKNDGRAAAKVRELWRLDHAPSNSDSLRTLNLENKVWEWLQSKGFRKNRRYVFLFAKQGKRNAEKAHHFTSILTWRLLQETISAKTSVIPVACGDRIGLRTLPDLAQFWDDDVWKGIFTNVVVDPRAAQMGMWCYLAEKFAGVSIVGMRSGILEVPALLGIRTLYLEEKHNQQAQRMARWIGAVPGYDRKIVDRPAGIAQQIYWRDASLKTPRSGEVHRHATSQGQHVRGLVAGFEKLGMRNTQPNTLKIRCDPEDPAYGQRLASATFGRQGLARIVGADKFKLSEAEFNDIVRWVNNTPRPRGFKDNVYGAVNGHLEKRDVAEQDLAGLKKEKTWSQFLSSPEYLDTLPESVPSALADI